MSHWLFCFASCAPGCRVGESAGREGGVAGGVPAARRDRARWARARPGGCRRRGGRLRCSPRRRGRFQIVRISALLRSDTADAIECIEPFAYDCRIICRPDLTITEECFELLSLIAIASEDGAHKFCEPGVIDMLFGQISNFPDGTRISWPVSCLLLHSPSSYREILAATLAPTF